VQFRKDDGFIREFGPNSTAAFVALARKIARLCFILLRKEINFEPSFRSGESGIGKKIIKFSGPRTSRLHLQPRSLRKSRCLHLFMPAFFEPQKTG